jgi:hypothetical protein
VSWEWVVIAKNAEPAVGDARRIPRVIDRRSGPSKIISAACFMSLAKAVRVTILADSIVAFE